MANAADMATTAMAAAIMEATATEDMATAIKATATETRAMATAIKDTDTKDTVMATKAMEVSTEATKLRVCLPENTLLRDDMSLSLIN